MATDYEALARQFGGTASVSPKINYDDLASKYGGQATAQIPIDPNLQAPAAVAPIPTQETSFGEKLIGAGEAGLSMLTGIVGAPVGMIQGAGEGLAKSILSGEFGTPQAANAIEQAATRQVGRFTYTPRTQAGQEAMQTVAKYAGMLPPVLPQIAAPGMIMQAAGQAAPIAQATAQRVAAAAPAVAQSVITAPVRGVQAVGRVVGVGQPTAPTAPTGGALQRGSAGAAGVTPSLERVTRAEMMPVPFEGPSALTAGQATRNFNQLQFEKEMAKQGELGAPLRERVENQTANMIRNFDALIDMPSPLATEPRAIGMGVDRALVNRVEVQRKKVRDAYKRAEAEGELQAPVELDPFAQQLAELQSLEGLVPTIPAVRREAIRLGALVDDGQGNLIPQPIDLKTSETLRQFVNANTDWADRREALVSRKINDSIDMATQNAGGEAYRAARKLRAQFANEFENVGLTAKLLGTKRGTDERQIAFGDVFDKVIVTSPVEEMNKLRSTLLKAGPEGQQAWSDLKAGGIQYIKDRSFSPSQRDSAGNPLLSPDKLQRTVKAMDSEGKLEALYGKRQAQVLRDLADLSTDIYTAPPGAINTSNTASALMIAMDTIGTAALTGMPAPAVTALREASKYVKNRKTRARIEAALRGQVTSSD